MPDLYITEQGARLERLSQRLVVRKHDEKLLELPVKDVDRVVIFGAVQVTTQALGLLLEKGIDLNLLSVHGRFRGKLSAGLSKNIQLRLAQHSRLQDEKFKLNFDINIVEAKIKSQQSIMKRFMRNHNDTGFTQELSVSDNALKLLPQQADVDAVRAVEGMAAAAYFSAFSRMVYFEPGFVKRSRRPPLDPVNGLLSLGYALTGGELAGLIEYRGLDPFMGFYHTAKHGRQSLALDVLEEFRHPLVDRLTLKILNTGTLSQADFGKGSRKEAYLKDESFKRYIVLYEDYLTRRFFVRKLDRKLCFRELFRIQVDKLAGAVKCNTSYEPFTME